MVIIVPGVVIVDKSTTAFLGYTTVDVSTCTTLVL
jgi:hypothetical protein